MTRWWRAALILVVLCGVVACDTGTSERTETSTARMQATADGLTLDGSPWWPAGLNAYQLATDWSVNRGCGAEVDLDSFFASLPEASLTRFNAFHWLAIDKKTGALDFTGIDAVFRAAEAHRQLLIPVLAAQDGACGDEIFKTSNWYAGDWKTVAPGSVLSYQDWVTTAVGRWRDSPSLAMWELIGEPEPLLPDRTCTPQAASLLRAFVDEVGGSVRALDAEHPITLGTIGGGQCGTAGEDYAYVGASPALDVLQYHDYGADGVPLPGDRYNGLAVHLQQARGLGKPLLVAEIGQSAGAGCGSVGDRARDVANKLDGQREAGTAGALLWAFVPDPRPAECTYDIGPDDPLRRVLRERNGTR
ncbi:beta-mannosidase [Rhodococcus oxybenzonivorans]|uniref:beta-mannosidase n=1 Tax=Rhodococcus oxybenzonivorans TaxID=1990687 RepID=UPI002952F39C|nr:beta-mannosidase [Rhodococcus oxybenzonivorans]MDV7354494.1 beta-mannosidase [Rhodococcus oxybenzonivorans]